MGNHLLTNYNKYSTKQIEHTIDIMSLALPVGLFIKSAYQGEIFYTAITNNQLECFNDHNFNQPHQHSHFEIMYVVKGQLINYIEDKKVIYQAGDGCLMNRNVIHYEELASDCIVFFIDIAPDLIYQLFKQEPLKLAGNIFEFLQANLIDKDNAKRSYIEFSTLKFGKKNKFLTLVDQLQIELLATDYGKNFFQHGLILRILSSLQNELEFSTQVMNLDLNKQDFLISRVLLLLKQTNGNISRNELANRLHYSPDYLGRIIKKHTGKTINELANEQRVTSIKRYLIDSNLPTTKIASLTGFKSESHFFHFFKQETRMTPTTYRNMKKH